MTESISFLVIAYLIFISVPVFLFVSISIRRGRYNKLLSRFEQQDKD